MGGAARALERATEGGRCQGAPHVVAAGAERTSDGLEKGFRGRHVSAPAAASVPRAWAAAAEERRVARVRGATASSAACGARFSPS